MRRSFGHPDVSSIEEPIGLRHHLILEALILAEQLLENQGSTLFARAYLVDEDLCTDVSISVHRFA